MPFMEPQVSDGPFLRIEFADCTTCFLPVGEYSGYPQDYNHTDVLELEEIPGWFYRLSAPGYLYSTGWSGPFASELKARLDLAQTYGVCGQCGEDMMDHGPCRSCWPHQPHHDIEYHDRVAGAYWHFTEHHRGQFSDEYVALSALAAIYRPSPLVHSLSEESEDAQRFYLYLASR